MSLVHAAGYLFGDQLRVEFGCLRHGLFLAGGLALLFLGRGRLFGVRLLFAAQLDNSALPRGKRPFRNIVLPAELRLRQSASRPARHDLSTLLLCLVPAISVHSLPRSNPINSDQDAWWQELTQVSERTLLDMQKEIS